MPLRDDSQSAFPYAFLLERARSDVLGESPIALTAEVLDQSFMLPEPVIAEWLAERQDQ